MAAVKTVILGLYALGTIAYAVYAFLYCRRTNRETAEIYAATAAILARRLGCELVMVPGGKYVVRSGSVVFTPEWPAERCYRFLADLRELREGRKPEARTESGWRR